MGAVTHIHFSSSLDKLQEINTSFDSGVLRVAYAGANRNGSYISKETFERCLPTIYNCPIVCYYDRETDSIGGHDIEIVRGEDGKHRIVNLTTPVGVVPTHAKTAWETIVDEDGIEREYLDVQVLLWKRQEAYQKIKRDGVVSESMEISVFEMEKDPETGLSVFTDFEFTAFCLLGEDVPPCFEDAALEVFSQSETKKQIEEMMAELRLSYSEINPDTGIGDTPGTVDFETEGGSDLEDEKIIETEAPAEEEPTEVVQDEQFEAVDESAEEQEQEEQEQSEQAEPEQDSFMLNCELREQLEIAVSAVQYVTPWNSLDRRYWMVDFDAEAKMVYYKDWAEHAKLFGSPYEMNGDAVEIDFSNKVQMKWAIVPFDEGRVGSNSDVMLFDRCVDAEMRAAELSEKYAAAENELNELRRFKKDREDSDLRESIGDVFDQFADLSGDEAFETLRSDAEANLGKYTAETIEEKCFAIRGRNHTAATFSLKETKAPRQLVASEERAEQEPYNGLFQKYGIV